MINLTCKKCLQTKSYLDFPKDHRNKSGYNSSCKSCENKRRKTKATYKFRFNPDITSEDYFLREAEQNNKCAICQSTATDSRRLCLDHCHSTGKLRGLLCDKCNRILGQWNDNIDLFKSAITYLRKYS